MFLQCVICKGIRANTWGLFFSSHMVVFNSFHLTRCFHSLLLQSCSRWEKVKIIIVDWSSSLFLLLDLILMEPSKTGYLISWFIPFPHPTHLWLTTLKPCDQKYQNFNKWNYSFWKKSLTMWARRNCSLWANFPFATMFSTLIS